MAKYTIKERLIAGLTKLGYKQDLRDRSKYAAFIDPDPTKKRKIFVGESGAFRSGLCASQSFSLNFMTHEFYNRVLAIGDEELAKNDQSPAAFQKRAMEEYV